MPVRLTYLSGAWPTLLDVGEDAMLAVCDVFVVATDTVAGAIWRVWAFCLFSLTAAACVAILYGSAALLVWMFERDPIGYEYERLEREAWGHGVERYCDPDRRQPNTPRSRFCGRRPVPESD